MANPFVHIELQTRDLARSKDFYSKLFDWKLVDEPIPDGGTYTMINVGVDDVVASTNKARELGATVVREVTEVGGYGWFSVIVDPDGAAIALWKPRQDMAK